ncbi:MAG: hypothetical protein AAGD32_05170 [Planctomycetota bacterium]
MNGDDLLATVEVFDDFDVADEATRRENWALTPLQRLAIAVKLQERVYGRDAILARSPRSLEVLPQPWGQVPADRRSCGDLSRSDADDR